MANILGHPLDEWEPMPPEYGPPLPMWLQIYWPWYAATLAKVRGTVSDYAGNPVSGATVTIQGSSAKTNADGVYAIRQGFVANAYYAIVVNATGYQAYSSNRLLMAGQNTINITITQGTGVNLYGQVTAGGSVLNGVTVSIQGQIATSYGVGYYAFSSLAATGSATVTATLDGYETFTKTITLIDGANHLDIMMTQVNKADLSGTVIVASGVPLAGATVTCEGQSAPPTDDTGHYLFTGLTPQSAEVKASLSGYQDATNTKNLVIGQNYLDIIMTPTAGSLASVTGQVYGAGSVQSGVMVSIAGQSGLTDSLGVYAFSGITPGTYTLTCSKAGFMTSTQSVTLNNGANGVPTIDLIPLNAGNMVLSLVPLTPGSLHRQTTRWFLSLDLAIQTVDDYGNPITVYKGCSLNADGQYYEYATGIGAQTPEVFNLSTVLAFLGLADAPSYDLWVDGSVWYREDNINAELLMHIDPSGPFHFAKGQSYQVSVDESQSQAKFSVS